MDGEKINIVYQDGKEEEVDVVTYLNSKDSMNQYLVYTKNEKQSNGDIVIYISKFIEENGQKQLTEISDNDEWKDVQKLLREIANAQVGDYSMNEKFDYKSSLTDIKASLFDIYEDQERVIGSIDPDLRDKHVSEFIEVKDLALSLLEKIQKLYDNSLVPVKDNNEEVQVNNEDVKNNILEDNQVSNDETDDEESNQDNNDTEEDSIQTNDEVETSDEAVQDNNTDEDNTQTDDDDETSDESSLDDSGDDQDTEDSDSEESEDSDNDSNSDISFDNEEDNSNKYYLLCDEDKLHFAYVSEKLFNKIKSYHVSDTEPLEEDTVSDLDTSDGNIYKKDDLPVKGIIVRNDQYMKLALSKHRQEGVLKEAKNYRIETVKRKRQEQQKIELEKAKVHLDIQEDNYE